MRKQTLPIRPIHTAPLAALRTFELAARLESFARAAEQLNVTAAAVSHQIRQLEAWLGVPLFQRQARGLRLTSRGKALQPIVAQALSQLADGIVAAREHGQKHVVIGSVSTFALGWLLQRLNRFRGLYPEIRVQLRTNNNRRVNLASDGLDLAVRYGSGRWAGCDAVPVIRSKVTPLCTPRMALSLNRPADLANHLLLSTYHSEEWELWARQADLAAPLPIGAVFESSVVMVQAALMEVGVALADPKLFSRELQAGQLVQPFAQTMNAGTYWLTWQPARLEPAAIVLRDWLIGDAQAEATF